MEPRKPYHVTQATGFGVPYSWDSLYAPPRLVRVKFQIRVCFRVWHRQRWGVGSAAGSACLLAAKSLFDAGVVLQPQVEAVERRAASGQVRQDPVRLEKVQIASVQRVIATPTATKQQKFSLSTEQIRCICRQCFVATCRGADRRRRPQVAGHLLHELHVRPEVGPVAGWESRSASGTGAGC